MAFPFPETIHGNQLWDIVDKNKDDVSLIFSIKTYCTVHKIHYKTEFFENELMGFHFPLQKYYLCKYGPDPRDPCWISEEVAEQYNRALQQIGVL